MLFYLFYNEENNKKHNRFAKIVSIGLKDRWKHVSFIGVYGIKCILYT